MCPIAIPSTLMEISHSYQNGVFKLSLTKKSSKTSLILQLTTLAASFILVDSAAIDFYIFLVTLSAISFLTAYINIVEEYIEVFDFVPGFQYTKVRRIGLKQRQFIHSQRVILHEVITMQRVITILSCLIGPNERLTGHNCQKFNLINLFTSIHVPKTVLEQMYRLLVLSFERQSKSLP